MSSTDQVIADGSAHADTFPGVQIDRDDEPLRWRCPNGHISWDRTNNHLWCPACRKASESGHDVEPEHWEIVDAKHDKTIPYSAVEFVEK